MEKLTIDQALNNLIQVCAVYKGDLKEHQLLQESLKLIKEKLDEKKDEPKAE
jgi:hypothetical protein